jgi:hypothetical protein
MIAARLNLQPRYFSIGIQDTGIQDTGHKENITCLPARNSIPHYFIEVYVFNWSVLLTKYCSGDQIENNEIVRVCSTYGGKERCTQGFGGKT